MDTINAVVAIKLAHTPRTISAQSFSFYSLLSIWYAYIITHFYVLVNTLFVKKFTILHKKYKKRGRSPAYFKHNIFLIYLHTYMVHFLYLLPKPLPLLWMIAIVLMAPFPRNIIVKIHIHHGL